MAAPRVVSLLPSATEILCAIGAEELLVGRSHECDRPGSVRDRPILTGQRTSATDNRGIDEEVRAALAASQSLYVLDESLLASLEPDVILTQDLCEVCSIDLATVQRVAAGLPRRPEVVNLDPKSIFDVFDDLLRVGAAVGREGDATTAMVALRERYWRAIEFVNPYVPGPEIAFLEWMDPLFAGGHWTPALIEAAGGRHSLNPAGAKSRRMEPEELLAVTPARLILCPCGFDLKRIERELPTLLEARWWPLLEAGLEARADAAVFVDGNVMFNRPGPALVEAFEWLVGWINDRPELIPPDFPVRSIPRISAS